MNAYPAESTRPPALPGFSHINRYWDATNGVHAAKILPGEYYVSTHGEMVTTVLGSCIAACIRDRDLGIGGMNHFMLPANDGDADRMWGGLGPTAATRYGNYAMEHLINGLLRLGARREHLEVKLFGGGRVLDIGMDIGKRNAAFARAYVAKENLMLVAEDTEGCWPRKVNYYPATGQARMKKLKSLRNETLAQREKSYLDSLASIPAKTDIELF
ncbi:MAG: chemoreceptor glutamine deamidase CheD [Dehalococcoidia bacterium]